MMAQALMVASSLHLLNVLVVQCVIESLIRWYICTLLLHFMSVGFLGTEAELLKDEIQPNNQKHYQQ